MMKKFLNDPDNLMDEIIKGYVLANKNKITVKEGTHNITRTVPKEKGKVKLVIGNGGGHEPGTLGQVGYGCYDLASIGNIFAAQSGKKLFEAIEELDDGSPVLLTIANHEGDVMNGNMAYRLAKKKGIRIETVIHYDDVTSAPKELEEERRGGTGFFFTVKAAGAVAEAGGSLEECIAAFNKTRANTRTVSMALTGCTHPQTGMVMTEIKDDEVIIGAGAHGEGGADTAAFTDSYTMISKVMQYLIKDLPYEKGDEVLLLVNGMGGTTMMELSVIYGDICKYLQTLGIEVYSGLADSMVTTQETSGVSISLCKADEEIKKWWDAPCSTPVYANR